MPPLNIITDQDFSPDDLNQHIERDLFWDNFLTLAKLDRYFPWATKAKINKVYKHYLRSDESFWTKINQALDDKLDSVALDADPNLVDKLRSDLSEYIYTFLLSRGLIKKPKSS